MRAGQDRKKEAERLRNRLREQLIRDLEHTGRASDAELSRLIDEVLMEEAERTMMTLSERLALKRSLFNSFRRLDILQELLDDKRISEIMINGFREIFIERNGVTERWKKQFETEEQLEDIIQQIVSKMNRTVNTSEPITDARLSDGSRVHIVLPPVALNGPTVTIRKFPEPISIEKLIEFGSITKEAADFLHTIVAAGYNIFISGGTNSGKSTFLNALSAFIPKEERVITIEDSAELQIRHIPNLVRLETRNANGEGNGAVAMSELIKASLRMNPSRIVVGEVRGKEAMDMLQAMNTGHDGSLSTGHANSAKDMLSRLEAMVLMGVMLPLPAIRAQIASAIDILVHLGRMPDKSRRVLEISEVGGYRNDCFELNPLFLYDRKEDCLKKAGTLKRKEKLVLSGQILSE